MNKRDAVDWINATTFGWVKPENLSSNTRAFKSVLFLNRPFNYYEQVILIGFSSLLSVVFKMYYNILIITKRGSCGVRFWGITGYKRGRS